MALALQIWLLTAENFCFVDFMLFEVPRLGTVIWTCFQHYHCIRVLAWKIDIVSEIILFLMSWLYTGSEILPLPSAFQVQSLGLPHWIRLQSKIRLSRSVIWYYGLTGTTKRARAWWDWPSYGVIVFFSPLPILGHHSGKRLHGLFSFRI